MTQAEERTQLHQRQCSRRLALQAMYQWHLTQEKTQLLLEQYQEDEYWPKADHAYFNEIVSQSIKLIDDIDDHINRASDYTTDKIDPIELSVLRISVYELIHCLNIPEKVIVAEAIRLCKKFGSNEGYKLVNVILDKLMKEFDRTKMLKKS